MQLVPVSEIKVGENRQRREFKPDALRELARGISTNGLRHPITLTSPTDLTLVAGERRLRAIKQFVHEKYRFDNAVVEPGFIPAVFLGDLPEDVREEIELEENVLRVDLTPIERASAIARLHRLRGVQAQARGDKPQTYTATATEIKGAPAVGTEITGVRDAVMLDSMKDDPEIQKAKTHKEAVSIARKKLTQVFVSKLAENAAATPVATRHTLIQGSILDEAVLTQLPNNTFSCIISDPPYGIDAHKMTPMSGSQSGQVHEYVDDLESASEIWKTIFSQGARVCKEQAHLYMFCDYKHYNLLTELAKLFGWDVWSRPMFWHKPGGGMLGDSSHGPRRSYETILFCSRGQKQVHRVALDILVHNPVSTALHAAAKPAELYADLLSRSCLPGDSVLDPTCGSGPVFPAANKLGLIATGVEVDSRHYSISRSRLEHKA